MMDVVLFANEVIEGLSCKTPDELLELKLIVLAEACGKSQKVFQFMQTVFEIAESKRPLMIEMK